MSIPRCACVLLALSWVSAASLAAEVTIYRCTDDRGRLTLRDSPCLKGERQQARTMQRPQDPPARAPAPTAATPSSQAPAAATTRVVVVNSPERMYECTTPDGDTYVSDSPQGEPRWEAGWAYGYPLVHGHRRRGHGDDRFPRVAQPRTIDGRVRPGLVFDSIGRPTPKPSGDRPRAPAQPLPPVHAGGYAVGAWVHDRCHRLPHAEVCARLRDHRFELDRRYNSALQGERARISEEQRGIDARLASDCGARY